MANLKEIQVTSDKIEDAAQFMVGTDEYAVPVGNLIDVDAELKKQEAQLEHLEGFLAGVMKNSRTRNSFLMLPKLSSHSNARSKATPKKKDCSSERINSTIKKKL